MSTFSKACDFIAIFYTFYNWNVTYDSFQDQTIFRIFNYFEKVVQFSGEHASNIVIGINFNFGKFVERDGTYYLRSELVSYNEFCHLICSENCEKTFDTEIGMTIVRMSRDRNESPEDIVFLFASSRTIANEVLYAIKRGLGGVMTGVLNDDDIYGMCILDTNTFEDFKANHDGVVLANTKRTDATFPLLKTINEAIILSLDEMQRQTNSLNAVNTSRSLRIVGDMPLLLGGFMTTFLAFYIKCSISATLNCM